MPQPQPDPQRRPDAAALPPPQIARELARHVVGQDEAVRRMSLLVRQHGLSIGVQRASIEPLSSALRTPTVMLVGSSGSGKTLLARTSASLLRTMLVIENASSMSTIGYVGKDLDQCLAHLLTRCGGSVRKAEAGTIIFLDEIDKARCTNGNTGGQTPDVAGEGIQRQLLQIAEGTPMTIQTFPDGRRATLTTIQTAGMWVIMAGSFAAGLADIVRRRVGGRGGHIGFGNEPRLDRRLREGELLAHCREEDFIEFGMLPELMARVHPIILRDLDAQDLRRILTDCEDEPLMRADLIAAREGIELRWTPRLLDRIAAEAYASGLGARSLSPTIARATQRIMYEGPDLVKKRVRGDLILVQLDVDALDENGRYRVVRRRKEV
jgi:ATP-dependent Clp protease ATP-binding subunit ClpX